MYSLNQRLTNNGELALVEDIETMSSVRDLEIWILIPSSSFLSHTLNDITSRILTFSYMDHLFN